MMHGYDRRLFSRSVCVQIPSTPPPVQEVCIQGFVYLVKVRATMRYNEGSGGFRTSDGRLGHPLVSREKTHTLVKINRHPSMSEQKPRTKKSAVFDVYHSS